MANDTTRRLTGRVTIVELSGNFSIWCDETGECYFYLNPKKGIGLYKQDDRVTFSITGERTPVDVMKQS